jgi:class 3 adenylate cyclase
MGIDHLVESLRSGRGESHSIIAIFIDVRGFTRFAGIAESVDAALFLRKFYLAVLCDYLPEAAFAKPTGDGLMVIIEYGESDVEEAVAAAIDGSANLLAGYPAFLDADPMITFDLPPDIGIGIARGSATRLSTEDGILDYTGRPLNLAARLMNFARPRGVVLDGALTRGLPTDLLQQGFEYDEVYIRGSVDPDSHAIWIRPEWTKIPDAAREPPATLD